MNAAIEVDLAANARLLPAVLAPNSVVADLRQQRTRDLDTVQFLLQNSIEPAKFFLVYQMPSQLRARATADITGMLERGELIHNVAQTFDLRARSRPHARSGRSPERQWATS